MGEGAVGRGVGGGSAQAGDCRVAAITIFSPRAQALHKTSSCRPNRKSRLPPPLPRSTAPASPEAAVLRSEPCRRMILLREINSVTVIFMIMCQMRRIFTHIRKKGAYTASPFKSVLSPESSGNNVLARTLVNGDRQRLFDCPVRMGQWNVTNQRSVKTFVYIILASEVGASLLLVHAFVLLLIPILPK
jgi:hypothetical protein